MLKLIKFDKRFTTQLIDMMDEWTMANEKIIPWSIRKCDYHDIERYMESLTVKETCGKYVPDSTFFCLDTEKIFLSGQSISDII